MLDIKQGVPIPPRNPRRGVSEALRNMKPGDYVAAPTKSENARTLIATMKKRGELAGLRFVLRKQGEKVTGIWCLTES